MPKCSKLRRKNRQPCIGDLDTLITLQDRAIAPPTTSVDFSEAFSDVDDVWSKMDTVRGKTAFDGTNTETDITHEFTIRFVSGVTPETWVLFESRRFDIIDVEDFEERHDYLILRCTERGLDSKAVNDA